MLRKNWISIALWGKSNSSKGTHVPFYYFCASSSSNGIAVNQDFSTLNLTLLNNEISNYEGAGIVSFPPTGNESNVDSSYYLTNPGSGAFNLGPCNVGAVNTGTITTSGVITPVQSYPGASSCP